jgi:hypothetical protein
MIFYVVVQNLQREAENLVGQENEEVNCLIEPYLLRWFEQLFPTTLARLEGPSASGNFAVSCN